MVTEIKVYTRTTCAPCQTLKKWLNYKKLAFKEINVDEDNSAMDEVMRLSQMAMVPCTVVTMADNTKRVISGYNLGQLASLV